MGSLYAKSESVAKEIEERMKMIDKNGDGQLSFREFCNLLATVENLEINENFDGNPQVQIGKPEGKTDGNKNRFIDLNIKSIPNKKYYYQIYFYNSKELIENKSNIAEGWGALTYEKYFKTFDKVVINSPPRLTLMNKKNNLDKLGKEQINGIRTGTLNYKTSIKINGLSGYVEMVYQNYSDDNIWKLTGNMDTEANINGNGQMYGSVLIKGMYPGTIYYNNVIIKNSKAGGGTYGVQPEGLARKELQYTITLE